jgi:hypothetical protein
MTDVTSEDPARSDEYYMARARELRALRARAHAESSALAPEAVQPVGTAGMNLDSDDSDRMEVQSASSIEMGW